MKHFELVDVRHGLWKGSPFPRYTVVAREGPCPSPAESDRYGFILLHSDQSSALAVATEANRYSKQRWQRFIQDLEQNP